MIRYPAVAGYFYPLKKEELITMIDSFFREVPSYNGKRIRGAIVPHAGYVYSGLTASYVYKHLEGDRFVIIGPNHTGLGTLVSVFPGGEWVTPLGYAKVDEELASYVVENSTFASFDVEAHIKEHSIEVQLPFLQFKFGDNFSFLPIVMLAQDLEYSKDLSAVIPEDVILLASSDFSHYVPADKGREMDMKLIDAILKLDERLFLKRMKELGASPCGYGPVTTLILWAKRLGLTPELLHFSHSGLKTGDYSNVVDYAAIVFYEE